MRCKPCLGEDIKEAILQGAPHLKDTLALIADCKDAKGLDLCGQTKKKRSAYQEWTSQCLKAKKLTKFDPGALKDCARQWRERKEKHA